MTNYLKNNLPNSLPYLSLIISIFISCLPITIDNAYLLLPSLNYILIYSWTIFQPQALYYPSLILLGFFQDLIDANHLGINALYFILFKVFTLTQRKHCFNSFITSWTIFIFNLGIISILPNIISNFGININHYPLYITFMKWLIAIFIYPAIHLLISNLNFLKTR